MKKLWKSRKGLTILEVIMVLMLIGIISSVLLNGTDTSKMDLFTQSDVIKSHLRFAQLHSINTSKNWGIYFKNTDYWLFKAKDINTPIPLPGMQAAVQTIDKNYGLTIALFGTVSANDFWIGFDSLGRPGASFDTMGIIVAKEDLKIVVSDVLQSKSQTLTIVAQTGYIP